MIIPVLMYMIVILTMAAIAFLRVGRVTKISHHWVLLGAIFFLISDSILAIYTFHKSIPLAGIFIMTPYALAQYFIVIGIIKEP